MPGGTPFILQKQIILRLSILKLFIERDARQAELEDAKRYALYPAERDHPVFLEQDARQGEFEDARRYALNSAETDCSMFEYTEALH